MSRPTKKRLKRVPVLPPPPVPVLPPEVPATTFEQPLVAPGSLPAQRPAGGRARAKKLGKAKRSAIARKIDRTRWNTKKKRSS